MSGDKWIYTGCYNTRQKACAGPETNTHTRTARHHRKSAPTSTNETDIQPSFSLVYQNVYASQRPGERTGCQTL